MKDRKTSTFVYDGLGLPIKLINAPMKKIAGKWFIDINMETLQRVVLEAIIHKPTALTGPELQYIRHYTEMSVRDFGEVFGVSHVAVVKWENGKNGISPALELCIRLQMLNFLKRRDKEFRALYNELSLRQLSKDRKGKVDSLVLEIDASTEELKIAL